MNKTFVEHNDSQVEYFEGSKKRRMVPKESTYIANQIDKLVDVSGLKKDQDILEIGCGMGRYTIPLLERGYRVTGLDISGGLLRKLEDHNVNDRPIELYCEDILDLPKKTDKKFDVVVGFFTLHHMHDLQAVFESCKDLLKDDGRIVFLEPNPFNPLYYIQIALTPRQKWSMEKGLIRLTKRRMFENLENSRFVNQRLLRFGFCPPFIVNRKIGFILEGVLERLPLPKPILPFQIFMADKNGN